jgi:hypothetical protein
MAPSIPVKVIQAFLVGANANKFGTGKLYRVPVGAIDFQQHQRQALQRREVFANFLRLAIIAFELQPAGVCGQGSQLVHQADLIVFIAHGQPPLPCARVTS